MNRHCSSFWAVGTSDSSAAQSFLCACVLYPAQTLTAAASSCCCSRTTVSFCIGALTRQLRPAASPASPLCAYSRGFQMREGESGAKSLLLSRLFTLRPQMPVLVDLYRCGMACRFCRTKPFLPCLFCGASVNGGMPWCLLF